MSENLEEMALPSQLSEEDLESYQEMLARCEAIIAPANEVARFETRRIGKKYKLRPGLDDINTQTGEITRGGEELAGGQP